MHVFLTGHSHYHRMIRLLLLALLPFDGHAVCDSEDDAPPTFDGTEAITFSRPGGLPDREYYVYTPKHSSAAAGVVLAFHGYSGSGDGWTTEEDTLELAEEYNYIIVAPNGMGGGGSDFNSWQNQGSNTGFDPTGLIPVCDVTQDSPDYCDESCEPCDNRCYWTHCKDDDVQFVLDLLTGNSDDDGFVNPLSDVLSFDHTTSNLFAMGSSNGGMFVWTLLQDTRTSGLFRAASPIIGLPHCGYGLPTDDTIVTLTPVISITGISDETVSPSNLPWPGNPDDICITNRDGDGYKFVSSHQIVSEWATFGGCTVDITSFATSLYDPGVTVNATDITCNTWCEEQETTNDEGAVVVVPPFAVHCAFEGGHDHPSYTTEAAFQFFEGHLTTMTTDTTTSNDAKSVQKTFLSSLLSLVKFIFE